MRLETLKRKGGKEGKEEPEEGEGEEKEERFSGLWPGLGCE